MTDGQLLNITVSGDWHVRNHAFEKYTKGKNPKLIDVPKVMKKLNAKYSYSHVFIDIKNLSDPIFYCYSKARILKEIENTLKRHNKWIKEPRKRGKGQKNLWDPTLNVDNSTKSKFKNLMV